MKRGNSGGKSTPEGTVYAKAMRQGDLARARN